MSIQVHIDASGVKNIQNRFRVWAKRAPKGAEKAVTKLVLEMRDEVRKQFFVAGLQEDTGAYLAGITPVLLVANDAAQVSGMVVSNAPQAARLELGYVGVDAIGRHYAQPPYPHWRPAMQIIGQKAPREVYGAVIHEMKVS